MKKSKWDLWIHLAVGVAIAIVMAVLRRTEGYSLSHLMSDGFLTAAVLLLGFGALKFIRNQGLFDTAAYTISKVFGSWDPEALRNRRQEDLTDYRKRKQEQRRSCAGPLWAGLICFGLSLAMLVVYMAAEL